MNIASPRSAARMALAIVLAAATFAVFAQDADAGRGAQRGAELQKRFAAADKNGDGRLTKEEAKAGMPFVYRHFDEIDKARAGTITMADIAAFARERRAAKQGQN